MGEESMNMINDEKRVAITDDYMFGYVMRQPGVCTSVIKCLLPDVPVAEVKFADEAEVVADTQKTIQGNIGNHSVRLDVYLDDGKTIFNVEMQTGNKTNLPKRVRYYGGRLDCDQLEKAQDYNKLRPTYVIFICTFDPFGRDQYHYSFENRCAEVKELKLNDESYKLFFNATGHKGEINDELKALLDYFLDPEQMPDGEKTELVKKIDDIVDFANRDAEWRRGYMTYVQAQMDARNEGIAIGEARGMEKGEAFGRMKTYYDLVIDGTFTISIAAMKAKVTEAAFSAGLENYKRTLPLF